MPLSTTKSIVKPTEAVLKIPFESARDAEIAYRVLSVDKEPSRNFVQKTLHLQGDVLEVSFAADQVKNLRTSITSFFEALQLCKDTIKEFTPITATATTAGPTVIAGDAAEHSITYSS